MVWIDETYVCARPHLHTDVMLCECEELFAVGGSGTVEPSEAEHDADPAGLIESGGVCFGSEVGRCKWVAVHLHVFVDPIVTTVEVDHHHRFLDQPVDPGADGGVRDRCRSVDPHPIVGRPRCSST